MKPITLFSFGYHGWGNATSKLVEAADVIEASRGFRPPIFVDIRIRRSVRAAGFVGAAFEKLLGEDRHRWMPALGNRQIVTRSGPGIQVANPTAATELLDLALESAKAKRRVIFFCSCPCPRFEGKISCHRTTVATLVLAAARRRGVPIKIVEWPGGKPRHFHLDLEPRLFNSVKKGRLMVPLGSKVDLGELDGPPWGSIATLESGGEKIHRIVGPATWHKGEWFLQVLRFYYDPDVSLPKYRQESARAMKSFGLDPRRSVRT